MRARLATFSVVVFLSLVAVSVWATGHQSIVPAIQSLIAEPGALNNPWFVATLFDAYFGFLWFWLWVAYKEGSLVARVGWLVAIVLLGNMAMAVYVLLALRKLPADAGVEQLLLRRA